MIDENSMSGDNASESGGQSGERSVSDAPLETVETVANDAAEVANDVVADSAGAVEELAAELDAELSEDLTVTGESNIADGAMEESEDLNEFGFRADEMVDDEDDDDEEQDFGDENASPIEELVDEEVVADDDIEMRWYILKVQVNRESSICAALQRRVKVAGYEPYFGDILVPTEDVREFTKSGKQKIVKRKLYPGYIVVHMSINDDTWFLVRETPGIGDFTGAAGKPAPLSQEEIDRIIATTRPPQDEDSEEPAIKTAIKFKVGDRVRVKEGYFQNYEGEVSNIDERNGRVTVMINIFGRPNPVELDHWQVEDV